MMKLTNPGSWRLSVIMARYCVDRDMARRLKAGEEVDIDDVQADQVVAAADDAEIKTKTIEMEGGE